MVTLFGFGSEGVLSSIFCSVDNFRPELEVLLLWCGEAGLFVVVVVTLVFGIFRRFLRQTILCSWCF